MLYWILVVSACACMATGMASWATGRPRVATAYLLLASFMAFLSYLEVR